MFVAVTSISTINNSAVGSNKYRKWDFQDSPHIFRKHLFVDGSSIMLGVVEPGEKTNVFDHWKSG